MTEKTATQFAQQLLNPITKYDFIELYGQGTTPEQQKLGEDFAKECAEYSAKGLNGTIVNIVLKTQNLLEVIAPLNETHFKIALENYMEKVVTHFSDSNLNNKANIYEALNAFSHVLSQTKRESVDEVLKVISCIQPNNENRNKKTM